MLLNSELITASTRQFSARARAVLSKMASKARRAKKMVMKAAEATPATTHARTRCSKEPAGTLGADSVSTDSGRAQTPFRDLYTQPKSGLDKDKSNCFLVMEDLSAMASSSKHSLMAVTNVHIVNEQDWKVYSRKDKCIKKITRPKGCTAQTKTPTLTVGSCGWLTGCPAGPRRADWAEGPTTHRANPPYADLQFHAIMQHLELDFNKDMQQVALELGTNDVPPFSDFADTYGQIVSDIVRAD